MFKLLAVLLILPLAASYLEVPLTKSTHLSANNYSPYGITVAVGGVKSLLMINLTQSE